MKKHIFRGPLKHIRDPLEPKMVLHGSELELHEIRGVTILHCCNALHSVPRHTLPLTWSRVRCRPIAWESDCCWCPQDLCTLPITKAHQTHYHTYTACSLNTIRFDEHTFNNQECAKAHQGRRFQSALCQVWLNHGRKDNAQTRRPQSTIRFYRVIQSLETLTHAD